jgi:hypothetical protein
MPNSGLHKARGAVQVRVGSFKVKLAPVVATVVVVVASMGACVGHSVGLHW